MAVEFAKGLIVAEVVSADALERALYVAVSNDSPVEHALLDTGALTNDRLDEELARGDAPVLHDVVADPDLLDRLPAGLCSRLLAVPLRLDVRSNTVDVAVVNVFDTHAAEEIAFHLQANVVAVRASLEDVERALRDRPSYAALSGRSVGSAGARPQGAPALRHPETPPPVPKLISKRTPPWGTEVGVPHDRGSDIPIPLTRRKSMVPEAAPAGPVVALTNEHAGSDGDIFSHNFKLMGLGPLVGTRTWGGVIGIWPRHMLVDGSSTTQPEFSFWFSDVGFGVENYGTDPQVEVDNAPQDAAAGRDRQLETALATAMSLIETHKPGLPAFGEKPQLVRAPLPKR